MVRGYLPARVSELNHPLNQLLESSESRIELRNPLRQVEFGRICRTFLSAACGSSGIVQSIQPDAVAEGQAYSGLKVWEGDVIIPSAGREPIIR